MAIVVTNYDNLIVGKKLSFAYQFITGGKEYLVAAYYKFGRVSCTPIYVVWNLTDKNVGVIICTGLDGGECYPAVYKVDLLSTGRLATLNRNFYFELDIVTKAVGFSKNLLSTGTSSCVSQGLNGQVIIAQGTTIAASYLEWCDPGGENWDGKQLTALTNNGELYYPCSMIATDGYHYAYCAVYGTNDIIAVDISPLSPNYKTETQISISASYVYLYQRSAGDVVVYAVGTPNKWYRLDGIVAPIEISAPADGDFYHKQVQDATITNHWFTSEIITVDRSNIMPNASDEVSISFGGNSYPATVAQYAMESRNFSEPHPNGYSLVQGSDYGPTYKYIAITNTVELLGYPDVGSNYYGAKWNPNHQKWVFIGYDKVLDIYNPTTVWTRHPLLARSSALNPSYKTPAETLGLSSSEDHFVFPIVDTIDKKVYFTCRSLGKMVWYDPILDIWGLLDLVAGNKIIDGVTTSITMSLNACNIIHVCSIMGGHFIAISSTDQDKVGGTWIGRVRLFHVPSQTIIKIFTITAANADRGLANIGAICEVKESIDGILYLTENCIGHIIALAGNMLSGCKAWRINTLEAITMGVVWEREISGNVFNITSDGMHSTYGDSCHIEIAPNGLIYFYVDSDIYFINPTTGAAPTKAVDHLGAPPATAPAAGNLRWIGNKLYRSGIDTNICEITGLI